MTFLAYKGIDFRKLNRIAFPCCHKKIASKLAVLQTSDIQRSFFVEKKKPDKSLTPPVFHSKLQNMLLPTGVYLRDF